MTLELITRQRNTAFNGLGLVDTMFHVQSAFFVKMAILGHQSDFKKVSHVQMTNKRLRNTNERLFNNKRLCKSNKYLRKSDEYLRNKIYGIEELFCPFLGVKICVTATKMLKQAANRSTKKQEQTGQ